MLRGSGESEIVKGMIDRIRAMRSIRLKEGERGGGGGHSIFLLMA